MEEKVRHDWEEVEKCVYKEKGKDKVCGTSVGLPAVQAEEVSREERAGMTCA